MSKIQTIIGLLMFLFVIFSMDMIFGNPLKETFGVTRGVVKTSTTFLGKKLDYAPSFRTDTLNGNMKYSGRGFLGVTMPYSQGDDQPLFFGFSN